MFHHPWWWFCLQELVSTHASNTVMSLCRLFEMLLTEPVKTDPGDKNICIWIMVKVLNHLSSEHLDSLNPLLWKCTLVTSMQMFPCTYLYRIFLFDTSPLWSQAAFAFSLVWSVGGSCDADSREIFSEFFRATVSGKTEEFPVPASVGKWECPMTDKGQVYDYFYEVLWDLITQMRFTCV